MACGLILRPCVTFGELSSFSLNLGPLFNFGLDTAAFGVVRGSLVELDLNEEEEFCEVGSGPSLNGLRQSFWNHDSQFTFCSR